MLASLHALKALVHLGESSGRIRIFAFSHLPSNTAQVTEKQSTSVPRSQFLVEVGQLLFRGQFLGQSSQLPVPRSLWWLK